jgi:hypothetical protein
MEMSGWDIFVSRLLTKKEIKTALVAILGIKQEKIVIVKDIAEGEDVNNGIEILCQTFFYKNERFCLRIDFYFRKRQIIPGDISILQKFSASVRADILVGDETTDPLSFWLIHPGNIVEKISLPESKFDEENMREIELEDE